MKTRFLALVLMFFVILSVPALAVPPDGEGQLQLLQEVDENIRLYYLLSDGKSRLPSGLTAQQLQADPELFYKTMGKLTATLDKYSGFFTAKEYAEAYPTGQSYVGVGIRLDGNTPYGFFVHELVEGGSAAEEGIRPGDQIVEVGGADVSGLYYSEAVNYLRGEEGTIADIKVLRAGEKSLLSFSLERRGLYVPNVTYELDGDIAVIAISQFGSWLDYIDFADIYDELPGLGVKKVIFDLRDNPGGSLNVLYGMLDYIVPGKDVKLFTLKESHGKSEDYLTYDTCRWTPEKTVVLANEHSASAAEVFTGALKDLGAAVVVGNTTYGKARAQVHGELSTGDVLVLTTNTVNLPRTGDYQDAGIKPDYEVEPASSPYKRPEGWLELGAGYALLPSTSSPERVKALEARLRELGVFKEEPDGIYDWYTQQCVNSAQRAAGLTVTPAYASRAILGKIGEWMKTLESSEVYDDTDAQLAKALELCGRK